MEEDVQIQHRTLRKEDESERRDGMRWQGASGAAEEEDTHDGTRDPSPSIIHRSFGKVRDGNLVRSGVAPHIISLFGKAKSMPIFQIDFVGRHRVGE